MRDLLGEKHFQLQNGVSGQKSGEGECESAWSLQQFSEHLGQEGSCRASQVRDSKVPVNLAQQWHRTGVKLEERLKALLFTALEAWSHFSNNTFSTLTNSF